MSDQQVALWKALGRGHPNFFGQFAGRRPAPKIEHFCPPRAECWAQSSNIIGGMARRRRAAPMRPKVATYGPNPAFFAEMPGRKFEHFWPHPAVGRGAFEHFEAPDRIHVPPNSANRVSRPPRPLIGYSGVLPYLLQPSRNTKKSPSVIPTSLAARRRGSF